MIAFQTGQKIATLATAFVLLISATAASNAYASGFDIKDFKIKSFGIQNDNPFLKVEGTAGGTKPSSHDTIYGYVFKTDKGILLLSLTLVKIVKSSQGLTI